MRSSYTTDDSSRTLDDRVRARFIVDYGFTDSFALSAFAQGDNKGDNGLLSDELALEGRFELTTAKEYSFYSGFRVRYIHRQTNNSPDSLQWRLIAGMPLDKWDIRINQIFTHDIGTYRRSGVDIDTRLQATYAVWEQHRLGLESFSDFGYSDNFGRFHEQTHTLGPVMTRALGSTGLRYEAGYRYGLSKASPDHIFQAVSE